MKKWSIAVLTSVVGIGLCLCPVCAQEQNDDRGQLDREQQDGMQPPPDQRDSQGDSRSSNPGERREQQPGRRGSGEGRRQQGPKSYSIEQGISDEAQLHTIAFNGLAFLTGGFGAATFIPPGKVCDYFGFQYMRDIDAAGAGHNPKFLDRVAGNVLSILTAKQRELFQSEANSEATQLRDLAYRRFPLISAFYRQLNRQIPSGSSGLNKEAVTRYTGEMFAADAALSYQRAQVFGQIVSSLNGQQRAALGRMHFGDFNSWPMVDMEQYKLGRGTEKLINVAYMTLASEFFSWYAGSVQADTYFCPERHGTYFGGFYLKDMPAMGKRDFNISTALTGDLGQSFMQILNPEQHKIMMNILEQQRKPLSEIVTVRRAMSTELRRFLKGDTSDRNKVIALGRRYGELDGELAYYYAVAFARVGQTLTSQQQQTLLKMRNDSQYVAAPAYVYSTPLREEPQMEDSKKLFFATR